MQLQTSTWLSDCHSLAHGFFGRAGGLSEGIYASLNCGPGSQDDPEAVIENRRRVMAALKADTLCSLHQIHSAEVVEVHAAWRDDERPKADAMVTNQPGLMLGILTADCGPVLFADPEAGIIGAAHAGWKGATAGVLENTIDAMESLGASRANIIAALGPTISQSAYEVGPDFRTNLLAMDKANDAFFTEDHYFNLPAYITHRLARAGITRIDDLAICTYKDELNYFSYRRTTHRGEPDYGRQISCITLKDAK